VIELTIVSPLLPMYCQRDEHDPDGCSSSAGLVVGANHDRFSSFSAR
jgi:hypothetical protein